MPTLERRTLLGAGLGLIAAASDAGAQAEHNVRWSAGTAAARTPAPEGATDCHFHIYDARFPVAPGAALRPPDASVDDYRALQRRIGTTRGVLVQPSTYGTDNRLHLESLQALGRDRFRMVAVAARDVDDGELRRLHEGGVRGLRFNLTQPGALTVDDLEAMAPRVAALGLHCQVNMSGRQIAEASAQLLRIRGRLVFDHLGNVPQPEGVAHPAYATVRRLLDAGNTWVKLSGAYISSAAGPPSYADVAGVAQGYAAAAPERMLWGSDWPHPTKPADQKPDDAVLFDLLATWVPDEAARRRALVDNPAEVYGF